MNSNKIVLEYFPTDQIVADMMTKPASKFKVIKFAKYLFGKKTMCVKLTGWELEYLRVYLE